jgi:HEAT repeat protein
MVKNQKTKVIPFDQVITALLDNNKPFSPTYLHRFSDLTDENLKDLQNIWTNIDKERKASLMKDLEDLNNHDTLVCFDSISHVGINDSDPRVRASSINLLWECDDDKLVPKFIHIMQHDADEVVRATAASALGMFVYLGELEEIDEKLLKQIETALLNVMNNPKESSLVQRRVLEALGYSSREEVPALIEKAYHKEDEQWQSSAIFAMGRSSDGRWEDYVLKSLDAQDEIQFEAVRAAGELEMESARTPLLALLDMGEDDLDEDLRDAVIWSLSKIGGEDVRDVIEKMMDETDDDEVLEFLQNALDNLEFTEGANLFGLVDLETKNDPEGLDFIIDLKSKDDDEDEDDDDLLIDLGPINN